MTDPLLLLIRCLIILLLAMFIAQPILSSAFLPIRRLDPYGKKHYPAAHREYGKEIDSLARGADLHELGGNFENELADSTLM